MIFLKLIRTWSQISTDSIDQAADCNSWSKLTALFRVDLFSQIWVLTQFDHFGLNGVKDYSSFRLSEPDQITVFVQMGFVWLFKNVFIAQVLNERPVESLDRTSYQPSILELGPERIIDLYDQICQSVTNFTALKKSRSNCGFHKNRLNIHRQKSSLSKITKITVPFSDLEKNSSHLIRSHDSNVTEKMSCERHT